ncbi:ANL family adenylate-forming protein [Carnobacterium sp. FSL E2-0243]
MEITFDNEIYNNSTFEEDIFILDDYFKDINNAIVYVDTQNIHILITSIFSILKNNGTVLLTGINGFNEEVFNGESLVLLNDEIFFENKYKLRKKIKKDISSYSMKNIWDSLDDYSNQVAFIVQTSGSTAAPKLVPITVTQVKHKVNSHIKEYDVDYKTKELLCFPMNSLTSLIMQILPTCIGNASLTYLGSNFSPYKIIEHLYMNYDVTALTPTMLSVINSLGINWGKVNMKYIAIGGEKIDFSLIEEIKSTSGFRSDLYPLYGATETTSSICGKANDYNRPKRSTGKIVDYIDVKIKNKISGKEYGEIWVRGISVITTYLDSGKCVDDEGYFNTGDIGYVDGNNYLYIIGRRNNVIIAGGVNIHIEEIEEVFHKHDSVLLATVEKVESEIKGEEFIVKVVIKKDKKFNKMSLYKHCKDHLNIKKLPIDIIEDKEVDLISMGKRRRSHASK